ncbi:putative pectinesterase 29 [Canna indica]|uniref:pectinesterase n=1 Tax=Canna indica TaxID=4628 RepID=A0AAQ3PZM4_9LILI|nr:putative pectinesterase 29 [Canna indica]
MNISTFTVMADDFVARDIGFVNSYPNKDGASVPATAAFAGGDRNSFHRCSFIAYQDTVCDYRGRHYFEDCWIEGAIDFIYGYGRSLYSHCVLNSIGPGWLTAQAKVSWNDPAGFVFKDCTIQASTRTYLGRAWNQYATVVFSHSSMPNTINPQGWEAWHAAPSNGQYTTFVEDNDYGPGADKTFRVNWMKNLSPQQLSWYTTTQFIGPDDWLSQQP